jgi:hypothetical protein
MVFRQVSAPFEAVRLDENQNYSTCRWWRLSEVIEEVEETEFFKDVNPSSISMFQC